MIPQQSDTLLVRPKKEAPAKKAAKTQGLLLLELDFDDDEPFAVDVDNAHIDDRRLLLPTSLIEAALRDVARRSIFGFYAMRQCYLRWW